MPTKLGLISIRRWPALGRVVLALIWLVGCEGPAPIPLGPTDPTFPTARTEVRPIAAGPVLLRNDIVLRKVLELGVGHIRLALNPADGQMYVLNPATGISRVTVGGSASVEPVIPLTDIVTDGVPSGLAFGPDGAMYVVANRVVKRLKTQALIRRGTLTAGQWTWETFAATEPYPLSATPFDHLFNGIVVSADGRWVYVNSGSRTDHGEVENNSYNFPDAREVALTAKIFRLPAGETNLVLPADEAALTARGYIFASGIRNAYDPAFAPNGDLFAGDNGPDADYPDELNWLRAGLHYGFPWRFGNFDNPQQFPTYDSRDDKRLSQDFTAVRTGTYRIDYSFPPAPSTFTDPVQNLGPDAALYRADDGRERNAAAESQPIYTFTPHRSPLGLVFATAAQFPSDLRGDDATVSAFILSWGAAGGTLSDVGQDLLHLRLTKTGDNYQAVTTQIAREFQNPIDAVLIENRLYVLDFSGNGAVWELTFE